MCEAVYRKEALSLSQSNRIHAAHQGAPPQKTHNPSNLDTVPETRRNLRVVLCGAEQEPPSVAVTNVNMQKASSQAISFHLPVQDMMVRMH